MAASVAVSLTSNISFAAKVPLLMKATSNDLNAPQAYDLQEICKFSKSSTINCDSLLNFLLIRLEKNSAYVKIKVLVIMKYLIINGHAKFRTSLTNRSTMIRELCSYNGDIDPIHGDGLNLKIRAEANKIQLLLFDVNNPEVSKIYHSVVAPTQNKMQGFGNTIVQPRKEQSLSDLMKKVETKVSEIISTQKQETHQLFEPPNTMKPKYIPVYIPHVDEGQPELKNNDQNHYSPYVSGEKEADMCDERQLVDDITSEKDGRNTPSKDNLKEFVNKMILLDSTLVLQCLNKKLQHLSSTVQLKSLCVIEYVLRCDLSNISQLINEHCPDMESLVNCENPTIKSKVNKILLTISSGMKQKTSDDNRGIQEPPNYDDASKLPCLVTFEDNEDAENVCEIQSIFSGMNLSSVSSCDVVTDVTDTSSVLVPDLLGDVTQGCSRLEKSPDIFDISPNSEHRTSNNYSNIFEGSTSNIMSDFCANTSQKPLFLENTAETDSGFSSSAVAVPLSCPPNLMLSERRPFPKDMKSEKGGFSFVQNSAKKNAFSFVNDEITASKRKPK